MIFCFVSEGYSRRSAILTWGNIGEDDRQQRYRRSETRRKAGRARLHQQALRKTLRASGVPRSAGRHLEPFLGRCAHDNRAKEGENQKTASRSSWADWRTLFLVFVEVKRRTRAGSSASEDLHLLLLPFFSLLFFVTFCVFSQFPLPILCVFFFFLSPWILTFSCLKFTLYSPCTLASGRE